MYVCVCVRERVCVCVCVSLYTHTHTHTHTSLKSFLGSWQMSVRGPTEVSTSYSSTSRWVSKGRLRTATGHIYSEKSAPCHIYCIKAHKEDFSEWVPATKSEERESILGAGYVRKPALSSWCKSKRTHSVVREHIL